MLPPPFDKVIIHHAFYVGTTVKHVDTGLTKKIVAVKDDHYLTDCGKIMFNDEINWRKI